MTKEPFYRFTTAYVAFGGRKVHWWMSFLKKGFYHCFLVMEQDNKWIAIDPVLGWTDLIFSEEDLTNHFTRMGYRLIYADVKIPEKQEAHLRPLTCVETVKRFLGIQNPMIFTPYQLFKYLIKQWGKRRDG